MSRIVKQKEQISTDIPRPKCHLEGGVGQSTDAPDKPTLKVHKLSASHADWQMSLATDKVIAGVPKV